MPPRFRPRPTYANVVATVCLFVVLGGPAAATDVAHSAATVAERVGKALKLSRSADQRSKLALSKSKQALLQTAVAGPKGDKGDPGDQGPKGDPGVNGTNGTNGADGAAGADGADGADGSPDTAAQVLAKLLTVDGTGSGLDAELLGGLPTSAFQRRGTATACGGAQKVTAIDAAGDVTCATDADSGGTVTSVATGSGLSGGPITTTGTIAVDGTVQRRTVAPTCGAGEYLRSLAADGTPTCVADGTATAPLHFVGETGEAAFLGDWANLDQPDDVEAPAAWYVDRGRLYLRGVITGTTATAAFTLPAGQCNEGGPDDDATTAASYAVALAHGTPGTTTVTVISSAAGDTATVAPQSDGPVSLDGISFRACP